MRGNMIASALYGRCLSGAECHYITKRQTQKLRHIMCTAMGDAHGRRPDSVRLLVEVGGTWEPGLARIKRRVKHW